MPSKGNGVLRAAKHKVPAEEKAMTRKGGGGLQQPKVVQGIPN